MAPDAVQRSVGSKGSGHFRGELLVGEESASSDQVELCRASEGVDHLPDTGSGEEGVICAVDEVHRHVDATVQVGQLGERRRVEVAQEHPLGPLTVGVLAERGQEEL